MTIAGLKIKMPTTEIIRKIGHPAKKAKPIDHDEGLVLSETKTLLGAKLTIRTT